MLNDSDFSGAVFHNSVLNFVWAYNANFTGALFHSIRIDKPRPIDGGYVKSINLGELKGASFAAANISAVQYLKDKTPTFGTKDTILSFDMEYQKEEVIKTKGKDSMTSIGNVEETGDLISTFASWSPYESSDGSTIFLLSEFHKRLGLTGWPHSN